MSDGAPALVSGTYVAAATVDGNVVASVPSTASSIKYAGLEGTLFGHADNFTVRTGTVND